MKNTDNPTEEKPLTVSSTGPTRPHWAFATGKQLGRLRLQRGNRRVGLAVLALIIAVLAGFGGGLLARGSDGITTGSLSAQKKIVSNEGQLISQISKAVGPSVVSITTDLTSSSTDFFGQQQSQDSEAAGTGIVITKTGIIMTNRHVVPAGSTNVTVTLADGTTYTNVKVLGRTSSSDSLDIAFLQITDLKGHTLSPATIGDSSNTSVGDSVVAIGNALGQFQNTVTSGIISGFGRSVEASDGSGSGTYSSASSSEDLDNLIQTDAAINEGNSGGPLVNLNGQVIGINTAIASDAQNIGFAIPVNDVKGLIDQVLKTGTFARPYLGVRYVSLTSDIAKQYDIDQTAGAYVVPQSVSGETPVVSGSPADNAGLKGGDVITKVGSDKVTADQGLTTLLNRYQPGDKVTLTVVRDGKTITLQATLGTAPTN